MKWGAFAGILGLSCCTVTTYAQKEIVKGWHLLDKNTDGYFGISLNKAFQLLHNRPSQNVIVAVLDGGIDTTHEDLKAVLWKNPREIAGDCKDADCNGFQGDVYGWNFLGNPNGINVERESAEAARLYHQLKPIFENNNIKSNELEQEQAQKYSLWNQVKKAIELSTQEKLGLQIVQASIKHAKVYDSVIRAEWGKSYYSGNDLCQFIPESPNAKKAKLHFLRFVEFLEMDPDKSNAEIFSDLNEFINHQLDLQQVKDSPVVNYRSFITGDDENDWNTRQYGNSDVMGNWPIHGTHVSGIIAADRNNNIGIQGIADMARIMAVRIVPNGDEHDKDVALGIRYAVDNGAKIINMSFGKGVSPNKNWVDDAIQYAAEKDVLIIHAAGNEANNLDLQDNYPSPFFNNGCVAANIITVGASGDSSYKYGMVADFTNYGTKRVDLMAPGIKIYSTVPKGADYSFLQGTSMAAPVVAGIAALIRSYYPALTAIDVKAAIEAGVDTSLKHQSFRKPGTLKEKILFEDLCKTGGIANAYGAVLAAEAINSRKLKAGKFAHVSAK